MRVALVVERMDPKLGGREIATAQLAGKLVCRGHSVTILCQQGDWDGGAGVSVEPLQSAGLSRARRFANFVRAVQDRIAGTEWDVVHAMLPVPGAQIYQLHSGTVAGQRLASKARRGAVLGPMSAAMAFGRRRLTARLEREVLADEGCLCVTPSAMVASEVAQHYGRSRGVHVVFNAVDVPAVDAETRADWRQRIRYMLRLTPEDTVFLCVAKNFALKGVAPLIEHFAAWYHKRQRLSEARLIVVGQEDTESYRRHAGLRDIGRCVEFVPPTTEVFRYLSAADASVLLSWYDPCGLVVLESLRWGVPAITTAATGASAILGDGAGLVVESARDRNGVVAALECMHDPDFRAKAAAACGQLDAYLSMDRYVDELLELYSQVSERR